MGYILSTSFLDRKKSLNRINFLNGKKNFRSKKKFFRSKKNFQMENNFLDRKKNILYRKIFFRSKKIIQIKKMDIARRLFNDQHPTTSLIDLFGKRYKIDENDKVFRWLCLSKSK